MRLVFTNELLAAVRNVAFPSLMSSFQSSSMLVTFPSDLLRVPFVAQRGKPNFASNTIVRQNSAAKSKEPTMMRGIFQGSTNKTIELE